MVKDLKLGRAKTTNIIKNVIAKKISRDLCKQLQKQHFSVLVDESTDISLNKLCVWVKYVDCSDKVCDRLLQLITIDAKSAGAENLYTSFKQF